MFSITSLPAKEGDALWVKWGDEANPRNMIVDMGTEAIGKKIRAQLEALPEDQRVIELLVISHVDRDHIGGVLTCLAEADPLPGLRIKDIWFNGFTHLSGGKIETNPSGIESMGAAQGERLSKWLRTQAWNKAFAGHSVERKEDEVTRVELIDGLSLTVLGPTRKRLEDFIETWEEEVHEAIEKGSLDADDVSDGLAPSGLESMGSNEPPILEFEDELELLAETKKGKDKSHANGSSISLLLERGDTKAVLSGDAFSSDLIDALTQLNDTGERTRINLFKLPHHGSRNNVHRELIELVDCDRWLISSDGTRFRHPDAEAIARIISFSTEPTPLLSFNVPSKFNGWWNNQDWIEMYDYKVEYGDTEAGITIDLE